MNNAWDEWAATFDSADQPQFNIVYQLRQTLDPTGSRGSQEANIRDGRGHALHNKPRGRTGPRVDLHYRTDSGRVNLEVDLDANIQQQHQQEHRAAMQQAYDAWVAGGRRGRNPLEGVASVFVSARRPTRTQKQGRITQVRQVQYRAGQDGQVRQVTTQRINNPSGLTPRAIATQPIFTTLARPRPVRSPRFDAFWE